MGAKTQKEGRRAALLLTLKSTTWAICVPGALKTWIKNELWAAVVLRKSIWLQSSDFSLRFCDLYPQVCEGRRVLRGWGNRWYWCMLHPQFLSGSPIKDLRNWVLLRVKATTFLVLFLYVWHTCWMLNREALKDSIWPCWVITSSHSRFGRMDYFPALPCHVFCFWIICTFCFHSYFLLFHIIFQ